MADIQIYDQLSIKDQNKIPVSNNKYIKNFVNIFINGELIDTTTNMVVASGKKFNAQKIFGKYPSGDNDFRDYYITHFAIGSGGSTFQSSSIVLTGPDICDVDCIAPIQLDISNNTYLTTPSGVQFAAKAIENDGSIEFIDNPDIPCTTAFAKTSIVKCLCVVNRSEPTNLQPGDSVKVDEAGLYYTNNLGDTRLYARIAFPPKYIEITTLFEIEWYIIC